MSVENLLENLQMYFSEMDKKVSIDKNDFADLEKKIIDNSEELGKTTF
jgi:hypothetical protein